MFLYDFGVSKIEQLIPQESRILLCFSLAHFLAHVKEMDNSILRQSHGVEAERFSQFIELNAVELCTVLGL